MDKYYTPELEEFYLGFQFEIDEYKDGDSEWKRDKGYWREMIYDLEYPHKEYIQKMISFNDGIRVKYLDKEDIESLGFKKRTISRSEWSKIINDQIFTIHEFWTYNQSERENLIRITSGKENNFPYRIKFEGDIKNKSELIKLLKQLKIE